MIEFETAIVHDDDSTIFTISTAVREWQRYSDRFVAETVFTLRDASKLDVFRRSFEQDGLTSSFVAEVPADLLDKAVDYTLSHRYRPSPSIVSSGSTEAGANAVFPLRNAVQVPVFYATDRAADRNGVYIGEQDPQGVLHYGSVRVSIPRDHRLGKLELPFTVLSMAFPADPEKHFTITSIEVVGKDSFLKEVASSVKRSPERELFVFVHGYNTGFSDAVLRTAQLAYDLKFAGTPVLFSWPSTGTLLGYAADEQRVEWATPHLMRFLQDLSTKTGAQVVHLIAHSLGTRGLMRALERISGSALAGAPVHFRQVVLAAPDADWNIFAQIFEATAGIADRMTVYASSGDKALALSNRLHQGLRMGQVSGVQMPFNIDLIDASSIDTSLVGHSYFADSRTLLHDLYTLIRNGTPPSQRQGLESLSSGVWAISP